MLWTIPTLILAGTASAHTAAFVKGMYCEVSHSARILLLTTNLVKGGADPNDYNSNSNTPVNPLYQLTKDEWWMQKVLSGIPALLAVR